MLVLQDWGKNGLLMEEMDYCQLIFIWREVMRPCIGKRIVTFDLSLFNWFKDLRSLTRNWMSLNSEALLIISKSWPKFSLAPI